MLLEWIGDRPDNLGVEILAVLAVLAHRFAVDGERVRIG